MTDFPTNPIISTSDFPFAHHTMSQRLPQLIKQLQKRNTFTPAVLRALDDLHESMVSNAQLPAQNYLAPDAHYWRQPITTTWQATPWFVSEMAFFREIINRVQYWQTGNDPYHAIKLEELESDGFRTQLERALDVDGDDETILAQMLHLALWGNRADLSLPEVVELGQTASDDDLLIDDSIAIVDKLLSGQGDVHLITDNFGTELTMDMMLVYHLLRLDIPVRLHVKMHPTYVSDATASDVRWLLLAMPQQVQASQPLVDDIRVAMDNGLLTIHPDFYWHSAYFYDQLPPHIFTAFAQARVIISKGDANYRRALYDTIWDVEAEFATLMHTMPAPFVALRTLKSDPIVGITQQQANQLDAIDAGWRTAGRYGVIQLSL